MIAEANVGRRFPNRVYKDRPCRVCGKEFQGKSARHWFCSLQCKATARYEATAAVTDAQYRMLFERQGGKCAICETPNPGGPKTHERFYADHSHTTGAVRGLLCLQCNVALGNFGDDVKRLLRAAAYVAGSLAASQRVEAAPAPTSSATAICRECGIGFHAKPSVIASGGGIYCSRNCFHQARFGRPHPRKGIPNPDRWPARETACLGCGETFEYRGARERRYCSRSCAARHRRNKTGLFE